MEAVPDLAVARPDGARSFAVTVRDDESVLVRAAQAGDLASFERLYRSTVGLVHAVCVRMAGNAALAEELTQDAFVRAWERLASFRGESAFSTWVTRIAVNVTLSERRARRRRESKVTLVEDLAPLAGPVPGAGAGASIDLERAIASLPPQARHVFVLHDVHGWEHAEIARLTGLAVGTSKAHLHRARRLLREVLSP